jgi:hypothetical protein
MDILFLIWGVVKSIIISLGFIDVMDEFIKIVKSFSVLTIHYYFFRDFIILSISAIPIAVISPNP